jgi:hypothetical protein
VVRNGVIVLNEMVSSRRWSQFNCRDDTSSEARRLGVAADEISATPPAQVELQLPVEHELPDCHFKISTVLPLLRPFSASVVYL